ncbi:MAG: septum formation initiator family protein [Candidatus Eiseniibacteriota bacterium]|jgi:cell division protein FtsB
MSFDSDAYDPPDTPTSRPVGPVGRFEADPMGARDTMMQSYLRRPRPGPHAPLPIMSWLVVLVVLLLAYNFGFSGHSVRTLLQMRQQERALEQRETDLEARYEYLVGQRQGLIDGELVEKYARERYKYLRPGEKIYIPPRLDAPAPAPDTDSQADPIE